MLITVNGQPLPDSPWRVQVYPHPYRFLFSFGSHGKAQRQFDFPCDITINEKTGNILVADYENNRVQVFSSAGTRLKTMTAKELHGATISSIH